MKVGGSVNCNQFSFRYHTVVGATGGSTEVLATFAQNSANLTAVYV